MIIAKPSVNGNYRLGTTDSQDFAFDEFKVFPNCDAIQQAITYKAKLDNGGSLPPQLIFDPLTRKVTITDDGLL